MTGQAAYLIAEFDVTGMFPVFSCLFYSSAPPWGLTYLTSKVRYLLVEEEPAQDGIDYHEAHERLRRRLESEPFYAVWRPHLPPRGY
jgi:hypothetical protein